MGTVDLLISGVTEQLSEGSVPEPEGFQIRICCDLWLQPSHALKMTAYDTVVSNVVKNNDSIG